MKIQDQEIEDGQMPPTVPPKRGNSWLTGFGALVTVLVLVGLSVALFSFWKAPKQGSGGKNAMWSLMLTGYTVSQIVVAPSDATVLYACATKVSPAVQVDGINVPAYTVLRSSDSGAHWQDIGSNAQLGNRCQLAVNPANSDDLYAVGNFSNASSNPSARAVLRHSTDGGQTWGTLTPTFTTTAVPTMWNIQQLSMVGNTLFGVQSLPIVLAPPPGQMRPTVLIPQGRLVKSIDGGQTWTVVDGYFAPASLGVGSYAVDPTNAQTIYEIAIPPTLPTRIAPSQGGAVSIQGNALYKSVDGGAHWTLLLSSMPYGSVVQLASNQPNIVYAGSTSRYAPLVPRVASSGSGQAATVTGRFGIQVSSDGGAHWGSVPNPSDMPSVQDWFVAPDGTLYVSSGFSEFGSPTVSKGTATLVGTVTLSKVAGIGQGGSSSSASGTPGSSLPNDGSNATVPTNGATLPASGLGTSASIMRYDPVSQQWQHETDAPAYSTLLAVTASSQSHTALWAFSFKENVLQLYRYIV